MICSCDGEDARRRISRVLSRLLVLQARMAIPLGHPSPNASCDRPERRRGGAPGIRRCLPLLLGLAPGGVFPAAAVTGGAVRSYRTVSPLPPARTWPGAVRRCTFCGTFPGVAPAGRYPAPCLRGARTFLPPHRRRAAIRPSGTSSCRSALANVKAACRQDEIARPGTILFAVRSVAAGIESGAAAE
jgi:hypothetical protein